MEEKDGTAEHVFPLAIGGWVQTHRVCKDCNSYLGAHVDAHLNNHTLIKYRRGQLGLAGNSGNAPKPIEVLFGKGTLVDDPAQNVFVGTGEDGELDVRLLHKSTETAESDGSVVRKIAIDARDSSQLPKILQRERKRAGLPPLAQEHLRLEVQRILDGGIQRLEGYRVHHSLQIDTMRFRLGLLKIAYELAFMWLGESYLTDPCAAEIRATLLGKADLAHSRLPGRITIGVIEPLKLWDRFANSHVAFGYRMQGRAVIAIKIFDQMSGVVFVSDADHWHLDKFLQMDVIEKKYTEHSFSKELHRIVNHQRLLLLLCTSSLSSYQAIGLASPLVDFI